MLNKIDKSVDSGKKYDKIDPNILKKVEKSVNSTKMTITKDNDRINSENVEKSNLLMVSDQPNITKSSKNIRLKISHNRVKSMIKFSDLNLNENTDMQNNLQKYPFQNSLTKKRMTFDEIVNIYKTKSNEEGSLFRIGDDLNNLQVDKTSDLHDPNYMYELNLEKISENSLKNESAQSSSMNQYSAEKSIINQQNSELGSGRKPVQGINPLAQLFARGGIESPSKFDSPRKSETRPRLESNLASVDYNIISAMERKNQNVEDENLKMSGGERKSICKALLEHRKKVDLIIQEKKERMKINKEINEYKDLVNSG